MMKKFVLSFVCLFFVCGVFGGEPFIMVSYNIRNGVGMDGRRDLSRTAGVLADLGAEVIALQEVDSVTGRSGGVDVAKTLGEMTEMYPLYAKAIDFDGGAYGVAMLSRDKPKNVIRIPLPGREEQRVLLVAEFAGFVFMATHLSLTDQDQMRSLEIIDSVAQTFKDKKVYLAGDFNFSRGSAQFVRLTDSFDVLSNGGNTFPADKPDKEIDFIAEFCGGKPSERVEKVKSEVLDAPAESDHRPIKVALYY